MRPVDGVRNFIPPFICLFLLVVFVQADTVRGSGLSDYRLGTGDVIAISVFEEPELTRELKLSDAGTISYPFLGELRVSGLTLGAIENLVTEGLKGDYLVNPEVSVSIIEYRQFYVNGEVKEPGGYSYQPGLTLRKAVALAGGFTERASRSKVFVIRDGYERESDEGRQILLDEAIMPGDIITIRQSFF